MPRRRSQSLVFAVVQSSDQLCDLSEDMHPMRLIALVVNVIPSIYKPVGELHCKDDNCSLE